MILKTSCQLTSCHWKPAIMGSNLKLPFAAQFKCLILCLVLFARTEAAIRRLPRTSLRLILHREFIQDGTPTDYRNNFVFFPHRGWFTSRLPPNWTANESHLRTQSTQPTPSTSSTWGLLTAQVAEIALLLRAGDAEQVSSLCLAGCPRLVPRQHGWWVELVAHVCGRVLLPKCATAMLCSETDSSATRL